MSNANQKTISRNVWWVMCFSLFALLILLILCYFKKPESRLRPGTDLEGALRNGDFTLAVLARPDTSVEVFSIINGSKADPCGKMDGTKVDPNCPIKGELTDSNVLEFLKFKVNPNCTAIKDGAGKIKYWIHSDGPYQGAKPCHTTSPHN